MTHRFTSSQLFQFVVFCVRLCVPSSVRVFPCVLPSVGLVYAHRFWVRPVVLGLPTCFWPCLCPPLLIILSCVTDLLHTDHISGSLQSVPRFLNTCIFAGQNSSLLTEEKSHQYPLGYLTRFFLLFNVKFEVWLNVQAIKYIWKCHQIIAILRISQVNKGRDEEMFLRRFGHYA